MLFNQQTLTFVFDFQTQKSPANAKLSSEK
jgi:hypothetical protein